MLTQSLALLLIVAQQHVEPPPTFKSGINLVEVDVVVRDERGVLVRGLRQQDFDVFEDDKPVSIVTFNAVDLPQARVDAAIPPADRSGTSFASNDQPEDGRVLLIVMDDHHVRFGATQIVKAKAIARTLVERLGPSDQAAVIATGGRSIMEAEFTTDKARLVEAIDKFFPQAAGAAGGLDMRSNVPGSRPRGGFGFEQDIKARWAMDALSNAARALALIPHRRKGILLVSEGLPVSVEQVIADRNAAGAWHSFREFILTAQRSNVAVYPVDPCGLGLDCSRPAQENLRALGESTGGFAVLNTNAPEEQVERIVQETGTYYLLGYASPARPDDGRRHRIKVRTRVPGVEIRSRESYIASRRPPGPTPSGAPGDALIAGPIQSRGLTMRVAAVPAPLASSPDAVIVLGIEIPTQLAVEAGKIDFTVAVVDASSARVLQRQRFSSTFESGGSSTAGWARLRSHVPVRPGRYLLRIAAIGANKAQGSVFTEVLVPKFDGDVVLGGLSIAAPGIRPISVNDKDAANAPPLTPLAAREVPAGRPMAAEVPIRIDRRASSLVITATLRKPDGSAVELESPRPDVARYANARGDTYRITLPTDLTAGAHQLVIEATAGGKPVSRGITFQVSGGG